MSLQPTLFLGHGNPLNALQQNPWTRAWSRLGRELPRPQAVLSVSAHWYVPDRAVTAAAQPRTIHDFRGFPPELYEVNYPAPGAPELARRIQNLLAPLTVASDESWGLDHGSWSVLCHLYPQADVPVLQLSIDAREPPRFHYDLGRRLAPLRGEGVLILGSGDVVHNLRLYGWESRPVEPYEWAVRFEAQVQEFLQAGQHDPLIDYGALGEDAWLSVPTPEHYLPLLYTMGAAGPEAAVSFPVAGIDGGSVSMLAVRFG
ncbi:MAG: 4,5-DOPA dioxygenase extradiol [Gammaproteobacteria bacterium]|nr:4,5-DOPA dioxygenase extradiol [Gammaproteobacteria bacterium]MBV9619666.1 4,5-DOPA dioxygenase extradiol [Gammaproteobacteria bacterium]